MTMCMVEKTWTEDDLWALGVNNQWYAVCPSSFVPVGGIKRLTRRGQNWVLFRETNGQLRMLEDRCPHRGARLSLGLHRGDRIQCAYHGVQVDGTGTVAAVPALPDASMADKKLVPSLPIREIGGAVLAYFGDAKHPEPCELEVPAPLVDPEIDSFLCYVEWKIPWRWGMENLVDPMHGAFLHHESHAMYQGETSARFKIRETAKGFIFEKTDQRGVNFDWSELTRGGVDWVDLEIPYPPSGGPGGPFGIVGMITPIDEHSSAVFFWRYRKVSGWERDVWRFLYKTTLEARHFAVLEQDREMLEGMPDDADQAENLYQHDLGVSRVRRLYRAEARRQIKELNDESA